MVISGGEEARITDRYNGGWQRLPAFIFFLIAFVTIRI
jgi:hypothetical protein